MYIKMKISQEHVYRIAPTINSATRSFIAELELPNRNDLLKPGMFVRVSMDLGEVETFVVPATYCSGSGRYKYQVCIC